jgi:predicted RNA-binding protein YlxR (DUF448 family)
LAIRSCVICRSTRPVSELLRLGSEDGRLHLRTIPEGRGAWVCRSQACLVALDRQPGRASRALRQKIVDASNLHQEVREYLWSELRLLFQRCVESGLARPGSDDPNNDPSSSLLAILHMTTDGEPPRSPYKIDETKPVRFFLPSASMALSTPIGRGSPSTLGLMPGKPSKCLIRQLRQLIEVG